MFILEVLAFATMAPFFSFFGGSGGKKKATKSSLGKRARIRAQQPLNNTTKKRTTTNKPAGKELTPEASSEENEEDEQDNMEHEPSNTKINATDKSKHKKANGVNKSLSAADLMDELNWLKGTVASQQEIIDHLQKDGQRASISISENEAQKALPTTYSGPSYLLDRSRHPSDIWTASVAACKTLSVLINGGGTISHDDPLLLSCKLQTARCARLSAAAMGGLQAAAHIEPRNAGKMADMYYAHLRTTALRDPTDNEGNLDEDKLIPDNIVFDSKIKNEIKDSIEQSEKSKAPQSSSGLFGGGRGGFKPGFGIGRGRGQNQQSTPTAPGFQASHQNMEYNSQPGPSFRTSFGGGRGGGGRGEWKG
jgi:hypothetical protein